MRILIVSATAMEIASVVANLRYVEDRDERVKAYQYGTHDVDVLTAGVGMVATAAWCSRAMARMRYDLALNFGLCGSFDRALVLGTVVQVTSERIAELGAQDDEKFLTIHELDLLGENEFPLTRGRLINAVPPRNLALAMLPSVDGITVNTVHGNQQSIEAVVERFKPQVESMEGAAFMYACLIHGVLFAEVRAVSNVVEPRNRESWNLPAAVRSLERSALYVLDCA
jgi:futalosine hydrolase